MGRAIDMNTQDNLDPIVLALVQNRLDHISRQMGWVMTRTARSPIFSQSHDFSCFISDPDGTLVSQADGIPIHTGGGGFAVRALLRDFAGDIDDGDVFILNDPYTAGGNHLPDWVIARPVFVVDQLVAFACNRAHQADIGGGAAGTYNSEAKEIADDDQIICDNLARTYYLNGEIEKAEEIFDDLIDRAVHMPEPYLNKALILGSRNNTEEALGLVNRAKQYPYSHLSYFTRRELESIIERIESGAE